MAEKVDFERFEMLFLFLKLKSGGRGGTRTPDILGVNQTL